jgi:hypothetical protein
MALAALPAIMDNGLSLEPLRVPPRAQQIALMRLWRRGPGMFQRE